MSKAHLPMYGVGPAYVITIGALTLLGMLVSQTELLASGNRQPWAIPMAIAGVLLMGLGIFLWVRAVLVDKVDAGILQNKLVTTGVYAWTRNPIYAAFLLLFTGVLCFTHNLWLLLLPILDWALLTVLMKHTEEKWLRTQYGAQYDVYCGRVNRCFPWFPRKCNI